MAEEKLKEETIRDMAKLTMIEGKINDIQIKNMKMFPLVFFNGVSKVEIDYNLDMGQTHVDYEIDEKNVNIKYDVKIPENKTFVTYKLSIDENQDNSFLEKRFEAIEKALGNLFWSDIKVKILFNDKLMHESKNVK